METEATKVLLLMMLVRDKTASSLQGKSYCALHDLPASTVCGPTHPSKLQVSRTLVAAVDAYGLVVPHQSHHVSRLFLCSLSLPCFYVLHVIERSMFSLRKRNWESVGGFLF